MLLTSHGPKALLVFSSVVYIIADPTDTWESLGDPAQKLTFTLYRAAAAEISHLDRSSCREVLDRLLTALSARPC